MKTLLKILFSRWNLASYLFALSPLIFANQVNLNLNIAELAAKKSAPTLRIKQDDQILVQLTSNQHAQLHLHGYDLVWNVAPNKTQTAKQTSFSANVAGRFPIVLHNTQKSEQKTHYAHEKTLLYLEILPR